ncbi:MAG: SAP domain-containing protein [Candidatus Omnitrophota bacterium]|jgi:hypothetical protein
MLKLPDIQKKAKSLGIKDADKYSKRDLIKSIQRKEGNFDCFGTVIMGTCDQNMCCWRVECIKSMNK